MLIDIPKDLSGVKSKILFGLTRRQLVCFSLAAAAAVPVYFLSRSALGGDAAMLLLIAAALPFLFLGLYEKNGQPPELYLKHFIRVRWRTAARRPYRTQNSFAALRQEQEDFHETSAHTPPRSGLERRTGDPSGHPS